MLHQTNKTKYYENIFKKSKPTDLIRTSFSLVFFNPNNFKILMKKETIEQASEYYAHNYFDMHETNNYKALKQGFEAGAKWRQEQDKNKFSEEDMMESFIEGYKQRAEKSDLIFDNASRMYAIALFKQIKNK